MWASIIRQKIREAERPEDLPSLERVMSDLINESRYIAMNPQLLLQPRGKTTFL